MEKLIQYLYTVIDEGLNDFKFVDGLSKNKFLHNTVNLAVLNPIKYKLPILLEEGVKLGDMVALEYQPSKKHEEFVIDFVIKDFRLTKLEPIGGNQYEIELENPVTGTVVSYDNVAIGRLNEYTGNNILERMFITTGKLAPRPVNKNMEIERLRDMFLGIFNIELTKHDNNPNKVILYIEDKPMKILEITNGGIVLGSSGGIYVENNNAWGIRLLGLYGNISGLRLTEDEPLVIYTTAKEHDELKNIKLSLINTKGG